MIHIHDWYVAIVRKPPVIAYRKCRKCGRFETYLAEIGGEDGKWFKGKYVQDKEVILIFTKDYFKAILTILSARTTEEDPDERYIIDMENDAETGWNLMMDPSYSVIAHLAPDWADCSAVQDFRFRNLINTQL